MSDSGGGSSHDGSSRDENNRGGNNDDGNIRDDYVQTGESAINLHPSLHLQSILVSLRIHQTFQFNVQANNVRLPLRLTVRFTFI